MWLQWDFGDGPVIDGAATWLFCAWLAWSRFRVVIPIRDKTLPTVLACIDATLRRFGGCPTYGLTDNEKTVTVDHVAGIAVRNPEMVAVAGHYGLTVVTCVPADAPSKGGSEATVQVAKADLVPTDANLLADYAYFAALEAACAAFCDEVNTRSAPGHPPSPGRDARRGTRPPAPPARATPTPPPSARPGSSAATSPMVALDWCQYSVPHRLGGETVWVRYHGDEVVIAHVGADGPVEVARHQRTTPGNPRIDPAHFPPAPEGPLDRTPVPTNPAEAEFLAIGEGAALWLKEAGGRGREPGAGQDGRRRRPGPTVGGRGRRLGARPRRGLRPLRRGRRGLDPRPPRQLRQARQASEDHSLQSGTGAWEGFGR